MSDQNKTPRSSPTNRERINAGTAPVSITEIDALRQRADKAEGNLDWVTAERDTLRQRAERAELVCRQVADELGVQPFDDLPDCVIALRDRETRQRQRAERAEANASSWQYVAEVVDKRVIALESRAKRAEAACAVKHAALRDLVRDAHQAEKDEAISPQWIIDVGEPALGLGNPGAAYLTIVEAARKRRVAERALAARFHREWNDRDGIVWANDSWPEHKAIIEADLEMMTAVDALDAPKGVGDVDG